MTTESGNLAIELLRRIDGKVDRIAEDVRELKYRMSAVETQVGIIHSRTDRIEIWLERVERRLDLVDEAIIPARRLMNNRP